MDTCLSALVDRRTPPGSISAAGRNTGKLSKLATAGFITAEVDLADPSRVADLVAKHQEVVLISGDGPDRLGQHLSVIEAAKRSGAQRVYYTSGARADEGRATINADHRATENALITSGVTYTILRNTWYIENYLQSMEGPRHTGVLAAAVGDAVVAAASRKDLAEALAVVVTTDGHENTTYSLSATPTSPYTDIAQAMSVVLGRDVTYQSVTPDELRTSLTRSGLPPELADFLVSLDKDIAAGTFSRAGGDLQRLIGRPTTSLIEGLSEEHR